MKKTAYPTTTPLTVYLNTDVVNQLGQISLTLGRARHNVLREIVDRGLASLIESLEQQQTAEGAK